MRRRLISIILSICMIASLLPAMGSITVDAAGSSEAGNASTLSGDTTKDDFGITLDYSSFDKEKAKKENPYGTEGWFPLYTVSELYVARGHSDGRGWHTYNYNNGEKIGSIGNATSAYSKYGYDEGNKDGYRMVDTAGVDAAGDGQKRYVANLAYKKGNGMELFLTDKSGSRVSGYTYIGSNDTLDFLEDVDGKVYTGFLSVAAGDFDGDGVDSIIVYVPEVRDSNPYIKMYDIKKSGSSFSLVHKSVLKEYNGTQYNSYIYDFDVYSLLGVSDMSDKDKKKKGDNKKRAPVVQLVAEDTDKDNVDELIITAGLNNTGTDETKLQTQVFIYDFAKKGEEWSWNKSGYLDTKGYNGGYNKAKRLRWGTSSVGNVRVDNGVDYPEIMTAGWIDKSDGKDASLTAAIGSYVTSVTGIASKDDAGHAIGNYSSSPVAALTDSNNKIDSVSEFTEGGHFNNDDLQSLLPVAVFNADGLTSQASILVSDTVYKLDGSTLKGQFRDSYFDDDDDGLNSYILQNNLVQDVAVGNFDGNTDGREQVVFSISLKRRGRNDYFYRLYTYQKSGNSWTSNASDYEIWCIGYPYMSLSPIDCDNDSTLVKLEDVEYSYTDPEVFAILESTPYFNELDGGDINNSGTSYGTSKGTEVGTSTSNGLTTQVVFGFEYEVDDFTAGFTCGFEIETTIENNFTWESSESIATEYSLEYVNDTGDNCVIMYRRPVTAWKYKVKNKDNTLVLAKEGSIVTNMLSVDKYNEIAAKRDLDEITDSMVAEPGNPFSYRSSLIGLENAVVSEDVATFSGGGTISQSFTNTHTSEKTFTYELNTSFVACGKAFGVKAGGGAGYTHSTSNSTINTSSITKTGTVSSTGDPDGDYDFNWSFAHWTESLNGNKVPVLGYVLSGVKAPPSPPVNLSVDKVTSNTAEISWEQGKRQADEYRIYQVYPDGTDVQVGVADGSDTSFTLRRLLPNTSYTYAITAYSEKIENGGIAGESVMSESIIATTLPEGIATVDISSPKSVSAKVGESAVFKADISVNSDEYIATNYQWQEKKHGSSWSDINNAKGRTLTINNVTAEDAGTEYRCIFKVSYASSASLIRYYSQAAKLTIGNTSVDTTLSITGHDNTGVGSIDNPYRGKSDYLTAGTPNTVTVEKEETATIEATDTTPKLTVYSGLDGAGGTVYYGVGVDEYGNMLYYTVSKSVVSGKNVYTAGEQISVVEGVLFEDMSDIQISDLPEEFNPETVYSKDIDGKTYYLYAKVDGTKITPPVISDYTAVDSRLESVTGYTLYWMSYGVYYEYADNGNPGAEATDVSSDNMFEVHYVNESENQTRIIVGREETFTVYVDSSYEDVSEFLFADILLAETGNTLRYMSMSNPVTYMLGETELNYFEPALLTAVTETVTDTIEVPTYDSNSGTELTLSAFVADSSEGKPANNAIVDFRITNTKTNATTTVTGYTDSNGNASAIWNAYTDALYSIKAVVRTANGYSMDETAKQYYEAGMTVAEDTTEYRIKFYKEGSETDGTVAYGDAITIVLQERDITPTTTGAWRNYTGSDIIYGYYLGMNSSSMKTLSSNEAFQTPSAGNYNFYAYKKPSADATVSDTTNVENQIAQAALNVTRVPVTVSLDWEEGQIPESEDDVTIVTDVQLPDTIKLKDIFKMNCSYFSMSADDKMDAYGHFDIVLSYNIETSDSNIKNEINSFKNNYIVTLERAKFVKKPNSIQVVFESGENGSIVGQYSDYYYPMESGSSRCNGEKLRFYAIPDEGYAVDYFIINGVNYGLDDTLPEGMEYNSKKDQINIESLDIEKHVGSDGKLTISVMLKNTSNTITYSVNTAEGKNNGTISAINGTGESIKSGTSVINGGSVVFTATPEEGYVVDGWLVNQKTYCWPDTSEAYRGNTLTMSNIFSAQNVIVSFKKKDMDSCNVSVSVSNEEGKEDNSLATVTAVNSETNEAVSIPCSVKEYSSITFTANVVNADNNLVKEWQVSYDNGATYTTAKGSGGQNVFSLYNINSNVVVRPVITISQNYELGYKVVMDGAEVTDKNIASLVATSNGQKLVPGKVSAYIPIDFELSLSDEYYFVGWSDNVEVDTTNDKLVYIRSMKDNVSVVATIAKKPVVTIEGTNNGSIVATYVDPSDSTNTITLNSGDYVAPGTDITIMYRPDKGYVFKSSVINGKPVKYTDYVDGDGKTTDNKRVVIDDIQSDKTVGAEFEALSTYEITYDVVIAVDNNPNGTVSCSADRKGLYSYIVSPLTSGGSVYSGSDVTFEAVPDEGYRVKEWIVNGEVMKSQGITITDNTLTLSDVQEVKDVKVQFTVRGNKMTILSGENGKIVSAVAGNVDQINNIESGFTLGKGASLKIAAEPDTGYEVEKWVVNNETVMNGENPLTDVNYTYQSDENSAGAQIVVYFCQIPYSVSWSGVGGTVTAENYDGNNADIRGGEDVTFTATPAAGKIVDYWTVNGVKAENTSEDKSTFVFTVPNGAISNPAVSAYDIKAVCKNAPYEVTYIQPSKNGTISARTSAGAVSSGDLVNGNTVVTFVATPDSGYMVGKWFVNGEEIDSQSNTHQVTVCEATEVSVVLIPDSYAVTAEVTGKGKVSVAGDYSLNYTAKYGTSLTFTAEAENYYEIYQWIVDGKVATDGVSSDNKTFTLSDIKEEHKVEVSFVVAALYDVSYGVENPEGGTLDVTADASKLVIADGYSAPVGGGSKLVFTATPADGMMVYGWTINGVASTDSMTEVLTIDSLDKNIDVRVTYATYEGYVMPTDDTGYRISGVVRNPDNTTPETEIRDGGSLTFTVSPDGTEGYNAIGTLQINGYDCLRNKLADSSVPVYGCSEVSSVANPDGSYTITVSEISAEIDSVIIAHKLTKVDAKTPTCITEGNILHYVCTDENCPDGGIKYADSKMLNALEAGKEIVPVDKVNGHDFKNSKGTFTWNIGKTVTATVTLDCSRCDAKKVLNCTVTAVESLKYTTYTATATNEGTTYTDTKKVANPIPWEKSELRLKLSTAKKNIKLSWNKIPGADGYAIYGAKCGTDPKKAKVVKVINSGKTTKWTDKNKKPGACRKYYIKAFKEVNGKRYYIKKSVWAHAAVRGGKYTNVKKVKVPGKITIRKNKTKTIKVKAYYEISGRKPILHMRGFCYTSSNKNIATVNSKGKIKAKSKGTCYIYVTAYSGAYAKIKVTVK